MNPYRHHLELKSVEEKFEAENGLAFKDLAVRITGMYLRRDYLSLVIAVRALLTIVQTATSWIREDDEVRQKHENNPVN